MSAKKAIQINPEYFSLKKNRSLKKQPREKKPKNKTGKQQKKELLKRLKEIQENKEKKYNKKNNENENENENENNIDSSIDFLNILSNEHKNNKLKEDPTPIVSKPPAVVSMPPPVVSMPPMKPLATHISSADSLTQNEPPYSNLKGSKKPSFREWVKSQDQKIEIIDKDIKENVATSLRQEKLKKIQKKYKKQNKPCKTIKITETFGKRNKKVSIHIKNKETKEKLENEKKTLKKHTLPKIKAYLKEHNLLKIGSYAPNDVIREMYENAMLSGDITNNNKDILVHNFLED